MRRGTVLMRLVWATTFPTARKVGCQGRTHGGLGNAKLLRRPGNVPVGQQDSQRYQKVQINTAQIHGIYDNHKSGQLAARRARI
jgi:hypothetical protein